MTNSIHKKLVLLACSLGAVLLSGCQVWNTLRVEARVSPVIGRDPMNMGAGGYSIEPDQDVNDLRLTHPKPVDLDNLKLPGDTEKAYARAQMSRESRNRLQDYLLRVSEDVCLEHKADIQAISATVNTSLSGTTSLLGGLGAIITGETASRALSGAAGIANALRDNINQNIYYNNVANAIIRQIDDQRKKVIQDIEPKRSREPAEYSVDEAIRDVSYYHGQCSFSEAVAGLADASKRPSTADELRGRLDTLRRQIEANLELINTLGDTPAAMQLRNTNVTLARAIEGVSLQLALVEGVSAGPPPPMM